MPFEVGAPFVRHALPPEESAPISSSALAWPRNTPAGWRRPSSNRAEPTLPAAVHQHSLASEASDDDASVFSDRLIRHALLRQAVRLLTVWTARGRYGSAGTGSTVLPGSRPRRSPNSFLDRVASRIINFRTPACPGALLPHGQPRRPAHRPVPNRREARYRPAYHTDLES